MLAGNVTIRRLGRPGDLGWVVMAHGEMYASEFAWDTSFESLVARIVADYAGDHDDAREAAWVAELDGRRVGCVFCIAAGDQTAQLRLLLVDPAARGHADRVGAGLWRALEIRKTGKGAFPRRAFRRRGQFCLSGSAQGQHYSR